MRVLMLGWEFPPFISGGLGAACYGLTRAMGDSGTEVLVVLPRSVPTSHSSHVQLLTPDTPRPADQPEDSPPPDDPLESSQAREAGKVSFFPIPSPLRPYARPGRPGPTAGERPGVWRDAFHSAGNGPGDDYGGDLFAEVQQYARLVCRLAVGREFDVIHAHDWMTYPAGIRLAALTGRPLVVHVHSTEFDRSGDQVNQHIFRIERAGMHRARAVLAVSYLTRRIVIERYDVPADKVQVVYNAIDTGSRPPPPPPMPSFARDGRVVLFLGRLTVQKGPGYFVTAARRVRDACTDVRFIMAGSGDLLDQTMARARELGLADSVVFPGFLRGPDVERVYRMADVYVMPSVSEPFGLVALEAVSHGVPTIVSRQSGVAEVLEHVLKVDYWDVEALADNIVAVLQQPALRASMRENSRHELGKLSWSEAARRCLGVYRAVIGP